MHKEGGKLSVKNIKNVLNASYDDKTPTGDFILDRQLSTPTSKVFYNPKTKEAIVAHQGTQGIKDWANNLVYGVGGKWLYKFTPRFKEAEKVQKNAERKFGSKNVSTLAHSQGGLLGELLGKNSKEIITLNKATRLLSNERAPNQYDIRSSGDVVSALNPLQNVNNKEVIIPKESNNPLIEHSIDILDRLPEDQMIGEGKKSNDNWGLHAVVIDKKIPLPEARKLSQDFIKNKNKKFMREETNTYRFRAEPKQKFKDFRSKKINDDITLVYGEYKLKGSGKVKNDIKIDITKGGIRAPIGRIGGKSKLKKIIVEKYFPKDYENMTYIEPFFGAGHIYFEKKPSNKEFINDLDTSIYIIMNGFKKYDSEKIYNSIHKTYTKEEFETIKNLKPKSDYDKFIRELQLNKISFLGKGGHFSGRFDNNNENQIKPKLQYLKSIKDRLHNTTIFNKDYKELIKKYDSPTSLFYLDPPYENSDKLYTHDFLPIKDVYNILKNIKGKFIISYNDSKEARELFKDYNIYEIQTKYNATHYLEKNNNKGTLEKKEIIITNFIND